MVPKFRGISFLVASGNAGVFMQTAKLYFRVDRRRISLIRFVFEAYEGLAVVSTLDGPSGTIVLSVAPGCESIAARVMTDLGKGFLIEPLPSPPTYGCGFTVVRQ